MLPSKKVWQYYLKIPPYQAQCYLCSKILRTGGGTTNVRNHLRFKHKDFIESDKEFDKSAFTAQGNQLTEIYIESDHVTQEVIEVEPEESAHIPFVPRHIFPVKPAKRTLKQDCGSDRKKPFKEVTRSDSIDDRSQDSQITNALVSMIYTDDRPSSFVEEKGFQYFLKNISPSYKIPSKNAIHDSITRQYDDITLKIGNKLKEVDHLSLSCLICNVLDRIFLVVVAHFISQKTKKLDTVFLCVRPLLETFTAEQLSFEIETVLTTFDIMKSKIISVCTDGSQNITIAVKQLFGEEKHVQCLRSVLNSVVKDGLEDSNNPTLQQLMTDVGSIVADAGSNNIFAGSQIEHIVESWTKEGLDATDRFILALPHVVEALSNSNPEEVNSDTALLIGINKLLALFEVATKEISDNEQLTGSLVLPMISCIKSALQNMNSTHEVAKTLRKKLLSSLGTRTKAHMTHRLLCRATLCDPRFQKVYLSPQVTEQTIASCCNEVKQHLRELRRSACSFEDKASTSKDNPLWWKHDKTMAKGGFNSFIEADTSIVSEDELKLYLGQGLLPRNADSIKFWMQSQSCMPSLAFVALKNMTVLGSTVPLKMFVPSLEKILSFKRPPLTDDQIIERMFLNRIPTGDAI